MSRKTDPRKHKIKMKKHLLRQHDRISWATRVFKMLSEHKDEKVREALQMAMDAVNYQQDITKEREKDLQEIKDIFLMDDLREETERVAQAREAHDKKNA